MPRRSPTPRARARGGPTAPLRRAVPVTALPPAQRRGPLRPGLRWCRRARAAHASSSAAGRAAGTTRTAAPWRGRSERLPLAEAA
eukprot:4219024-Pyramimonas_sp.AAC.1